MVDPIRRVWTLPLLQVGELPLRHAHSKGEVGEHLIALATLLAVGRPGEQSRVSPFLGWGIGSININVDLDAVPQLFKK